MILKHYDTILQVLEFDKNIDVIYLNYLSIDKVDFTVVLEKTKKIGIRGKPFDWIRSFFINYCCEWCHMQTEASRFWSSPGVNPLTPVIPYPNQQHG